MKIIPFEEKYRQDFINFNTDWIVSNFGFLEEHDKETFEKIDDEMKSGAMIFFAVENGIALATCMAMKWALNHGAKRLFIQSNSRLKPALHIYKKYGFKEIKLENHEYVRGDIAFEYIKE